MDVEVALDDIKVLVDKFDQNTGTIFYSVINNSKEMLVLPSYITLEKYDGKEWVVIPSKESKITADAMLVMPDDEIMRNIDLSSNYLDLSSEKYRICLMISKGKVFAEFVFA